jgi:hypothetical protein
MLISKNQSGIEWQALKFKFDTNLTSLTDRLEADNGSQRYQWAVSEIQLGGFSPVAV